MAFASLSRREFLKRVVIRGGGAAALLTTGSYGYFYEPFSPAIEQVELPLRNLPQAFQGLRILQLSDIHIGPYVSESHLAPAVAAAAVLAPDLIVLTGDFVYQSADYAEPCAALLAELRAPRNISIQENLLKINALHEIRDR